MKVQGMHLIAFAVLAVPAMAQQSATSVDPPAGSPEVRHAKGDGVQIYTCTQTPDGPKWVLTGPDARLLDDSGKVIGTHFAGPTWKLNDGGQVQGIKMTDYQQDPNSVPWLLLRAKAGTAEGSLATVAFIRRSETKGGVAPAKGCKSPKDVSHAVPARVPYTALYTFYAEK